MRRGRRLGQHRIVLLRDLVRRLPLILALMILVTNVAVTIGAPSGEPSRATIERWSFDPQNVVRGRWLIRLTADVLVDNIRHWATSMAMLAGFVGPLEMLASSTATATVFWPISIPGSLVAALIAGIGASRVVDWHPQPDIVTIAGVGASTGTWGAAGALAVVESPRPVGAHGVVRGALALFVIVTGIMTPDVAGVAHRLGFGIRVTIASVLRFEARAPQPEHRAR